MWNENRRGQPKQRWEHEGLITAVAIGGTLITLGFVFAITPDLFGKIGSFFGDLTTRALPYGGGLNNLVLPAPAHPAEHSALYSALMQFDIGIAVLQVIILAMRLALQSRAHRVAETVGNLVFWGGAAFVVYEFLLKGTLVSWFQFWAALIVVVGVSLVCRAITHFARK